MSVATFHVCADGRSVLEVEARPGTLHSMGTPPPDWQPPSHPFLHAVATDPMHEHDLRDQLLASVDALDFLRRVVAAGYDLVDGTVSPWDLEGARRIRTRDGALVGAAFACAGPLATLTRSVPEVRERYEHATACVYDEALLQAVREALAGSDSYERFGARLADLGLRLSTR
jgi:hypothetical protein